MWKKVLAVLVFIVVVVTSGYLLSPFFRQAFISGGLIKEKILIAGTGSMYPTFPKFDDENELVAAQHIVAWPKMRLYPGGFSLFNHTYFNYILKHGDIVEFANGRTKSITEKKYGNEAGFVKRVIGLPGDTIELRDGYVILNGETLSEPYTAKPRSTYGGDFLSDCKKLKVPDNNAFVLGDNRKASLDSRFDLGLVPLSDIHYALSWDEQNDYKSLWRDTSNDLSYANNVTLNPAEFVKLVNDKRKAKNLKEYKYDGLLASSAKIRGTAIIRTNDFSREATKSGITLAKSVKDAGYHNIIFAELTTQGYFEDKELLDNLLAMTETEKILYSSEYQDIGLAPEIGEIAGCPIQVVVIHFGGYVPPNYTADQVDSWGNLIDNLNQAYGAWSNLKNYSEVDQGKLDKLLGLLVTRKNNASQIYNRMKSQQWLTGEEEGMVDNDKVLHKEIESIISDLQK